MKQTSRPQLLVARRATLFTLAAMLVGCSRPAKRDVLTAENSNLKPLSVMYGQYQALAENRPPANEADFKKFIQTSGQSTLKQFDTTADELFVSERDGQPCVVFYRANTLPKSGVIAYEREGVNGERIVAYPFGAVELVDETRFQQLVPNPP